MESAPRRRTGSGQPPVLARIHIDLDAPQRRIASDEFRFAADDSWWSSEARKGLAAYDHPTMISLAQSVATGGFADAEDPRSYLQFAVWLGRLGCGYPLALAHLARVLGAAGDIDSRPNAVAAATSL